MAVVSLGFRTDLMLLDLQGSLITEREDGMIVARTPRNPTFWWGNFVLAPAPETLDAALRRFTGDFPDAGHVAIGVDGTDGAPGLEGPAAALDLDVERVTVLSATSVHPPPRPEPTAAYRRLASDADFAQAVDLQYADEPADGRDYLVTRFAGWRRMQDAGHGAWFGAFVDGTMRAGLGLFTDGSGVARFQAVDTHPDFRGRGLAGTLVHHAAAEGLTWPGVRTLVIAADPSYHAIRVYRSIGFDGTETQVLVSRKPAGRRPIGTRPGRGGVALPQP